ncbi:uncharacterized protein LTR77_004629 [Saxophila tyrrhenica]|uniref:FAS1 domain-containing protein n=1 Tax=Saxophila tyrrhenica TaxID=1690608 RepID=A0AAV9PD72_9PEZI|nr:hypothetical protein LTR77_004629 [Saxophila tyrrhenica]
MPDDVYVAPQSKGTITLLELIESRPDLSSLRQALEEPAGQPEPTGDKNHHETNSLAGFLQAFATEATWDFTFFAPSNTAFDNLGTYWQTFASTPKGKWWVGNQLKHHYVPNTQPKASDFNSTATRVQASTYGYIGAQVVSGDLVLNSVSTVTEADLPVTNGIVHIIDRVLDPSAQIFNEDLPEQDQEFIAGSCTDPDLPYC